jgi:hypothetical protein
MPELLESENQHKNEPRKILPGVKFEGQQPGEESAVRDEETPQEERDRDAILRQEGRRKEEQEEDLDKDGFPANEPSREGKFSA